MIDDVLVVGVGNEILRDEGVGVHVARRLKTRGVPVRVVEAGVAGIGLIDLFERVKKLVVIDAAMMGHPPGTIVRFEPSQARVTAERAGLSLHGGSLWDVFRLAEALGRCPEIVIFGVQPKDLSLGTELSPEVEAQVPEVVGLVCQELALENEEGGK